MAHPRLHAESTPEKTAYVMSDGSGSLSYKLLEVRANQGARLLRSHGLKRGDVVAFWLPNCLEAMEYYWAAQRAGLYVTPLATHLSPLEAAYILQNSGAKLVVICDSLAQADDLPRHDGTTYLSRSDWTAGLAEQPSEPLNDESPGFHLVYSSGTTGRPKGVRLPLPEGEVTAASFYAQMANRSFGIDASDIYLSVAPLYHTAPLLYAANAVRLGATVVIMPRFDPEAVLAAIERYNITVTQMVPTMFVRLLKLLPDLRAGNDLSTLRCVIHAAAPCPVPVKYQMIE